jgi:hypothetical protein
VKETATGAVAFTATVPDGTAAAWAFSPNSAELAVADTNGKTYVWNISG